MKTSKKTSLLLVLFFSICVLQNTYTEIFSTTIQTKLKGGSVCELLDSKYSSVSRLVWKAPINICMGFEEKISFSNFACTASMNYCIPNSWGTMEDYDYYMSGAVCQYSKHTNHIENDSSFCFDLGYNIAAKYLSVTPAICFQYQYRKFSGWNGYLQIPKTGDYWTGNEEKKIISGNGISYEQKILLPSVKININYFFYNDFSILGKINISPYLYANCTDIHYFRNKLFTDKMNGGFFIEGELKLFYKKIGLSLSYEYMKSSSNAKTYTQTIGILEEESSLSKNYIPGIESYFWYVGIEYKL
ncbi:MAG: omptin family outer membrane protease [Treponema sp.]|nr:omptin family outer membrane protease [Treponema sp.]